MSEERDIEAAKSIEVARKAIEVGDFDKAKKFLLKSLNFRHSTKAEEMLKRVELEMGKPDSERSAKRPASSSASPSSSTTTSSASSTSSASPAAEEPETPKYTKEQQDAARRIRKLTDYYTILSVERTATETDIKAAYRKLALKFHPDKNQAPEAADAFKKVSEAYSCLSDSKERAFYDQTGSDRRSAYSQAGPAESYHQHAPMTPEEIFNMFFEAHTGMRRPMGQRRGFRAAPPRQQQHQEQSGGLLQLVHMLPLLLLFLFSYLSSPGEETPFSLDKGNGFVHKRETALGTPYFVNANFGHRYGRDTRAAAQVEALADQQFLKRLEDLCKKETRQAKEMLASARKKNDPHELHKAHDFVKQSCERLQQMRSR